MAKETEDAHFLHVGLVSTFVIALLAIFGMVILIIS
jgi:hypothetical protein